MTRNRLKKEEGPANPAPLQEAKAVTPQIVKTEARPVGVKEVKTQ